ncbi:hypothetical protein [Novosphingobium sp. FSW06-99]|uniref:head-tail joining protein n=1 Tax=Novosphingobium sp. FSW06-99 TaxID=1739113 RepID=UPI00076CF256|nr:hypothetical protein [Novosphingobium sp. FSW06-99]KUR80762.1 hypothetical protein AQZ49_01665 [Novosphingobium sp. FSW06-99]
MAIDWDSLLLGPVMGVFGEAISYVPRGGAPIAIADAVFDEESADIAIGEDAQMSTQRKPICGIRIGALGQAASQGDTILRLGTGVAYIVKDVIPDGHGHAKLVLMSKSGS